MTDPTPTPTPTLEPTPTPTVDPTPVAPTGPSIEQLLAHIASQNDTLIVAVVCLALVVSILAGLAIVKFIFA